MKHLQTKGDMSKISTKFCVIKGQETMNTQITHLKVCVSCSDATSFYDNDEKLRLSHENVILISNNKVTLLRFSNLVFQLNCAY